MATLVVRLAFTAAIAFAATLAAGDDIPSKTKGQSVPTQHGPISVVGTKGYLKKVRSFRISPQQAWDRAKAHSKARQDKTTGVPRYHLLIVGDDYLFSAGWDKTTMWLHGYFVDGNTGKVTVRRPFWRVTYRDYPELDKALAAILRAEKSQLNQGEAAISND